ncbi:MAG: ribonuclease Z [Candidatus Methanomethylicia archaeon]
MSIKLVFLGTSAGLPTIKRGLSCIALKYHGDLLIFDCGEGAQRSIIMAGLGFPKNLKIFITHMHSDHVLGILGLLQTLSLMNRSFDLHVYGPRGISDFINFNKKILNFHLSYELFLHEINPGVILDDKDYIVRAVETEHVKPSFAYSFEEKPRPGKFHPDRALALGIPKGPLWRKLQNGFPVSNIFGDLIFPEQVMDPPRAGLKIVFSGDTRPCENILNLSRNADILIYDSTFDDSMIDKAISDMHSTAGEAAELAAKANVKLLVLTHISARYESSPDILLKQAKEKFSNVIIAEDFLELSISKNTFNLRRLI